ncbi:MAG: S53 family peptidase [Thermaerobacter sp.]|nr:S53 family peptidase [Thermaerobacter sp.]
MGRLTGHMLPQDGVPGVPAADSDRPLELALVLHPVNLADAEQTVLSQDGPLDRAEFLTRHGVPPELATQMTEWLSGSGLTVRPDGLVFWLAGTMAAVAKTFDLAFRVEVKDTTTYYQPTREPQVPDWMEPWVAGIAGLDNVARLIPSVRFPRDTEQLANQGQGFFPADIKRAYAFPSTYDGSGMTIGLLEFSNGYSTYDVMAFWSAYHLPTPTLSFVSVDGTANDGGANAWDLEATLDVEWAGAMAPGAHLVVYEASAGGTDVSFGLSVLKALHTAIHDTVHRPTVLSISYGDGESRFPPRVMEAWNSVMAHGAIIGITTFVASGDQGAYGLHGAGRLIAHADAPANCPHAVAVGGTRLLLNPNGSIARETGWTDTNNNGASGGGISQVFPVPAFQIGIALPVKPGFHAGRGVPDVAANADPDTGYAVVFQGSAAVVGGTSVASPIWAAAGACLNQARAAAQKGPIGLFNPRLYALGATPVFHDIVIGNNSYAGVAGYSCGPGWDAVTGWGSPDLTRLIADLE